VCVIPTGSVKVIDCISTGILPVFVKVNNLAGGIVVVVVVIAGAAVVVVVIVGPAHGGATPELPKQFIVPATVPFTTPFKRSVTTVRLSAVKYEPFNQFKSGIFIKVPFTLALNPPGQPPIHTMA
jgi:hypothetical protein